MLANQALANDYNHHASDDDEVVKGDKVMMLMGIFTGEIASGRVMLIFFAIGDADDDTDATGDDGDGSDVDDDDDGDGDVSGDGDGASGSGQEWAGPGNAVQSQGL